MELVIDKMMKKKVSIIPLILSIVIAAAWTLRWAIESRDISLGEIANLYGGNITAQDITEIRLNRHLFAIAWTDEEIYNSRTIVLKPGDPEFEQYLTLWTSRQFKMKKYDTADNPILPYEETGIPAPRVSYYTIVDGENLLALYIDVFPDENTCTFWRELHHDYFYQYPDDCELLNPNYIDYLIGRKKGPDYPRIYDYATSSPYMRWSWS